jgi:hypothetical protein
MENKQTAVEWLHSELDGLEMTKNKRSLVLNLDLRAELFQQAKAMEKEQIKNAHKDNTIMYEMDADGQAEQYYNEIYGN